MNGWMDDSLMNELMDWWMMFVVKIDEYDVHKIEWMILWMNEYKPTDE